MRVFDREMIALAPSTEMLRAWRWFESGTRLLRPMVPPDLRPTLLIIVLLMTVTITTPIVALYLFFLSLFFVVLCDSVILVILTIE